MKKVLQKGFTLIELLVVVAIIGILASVVLASLNSARTKGADAAIKADLANIRVQAQLYYDSTLGNNSYGLTASSTCPTTVSAAGTTASLWTDPTLSAAIVQAASQAGASANVHCIGIGSPITAFAVAALLKTPSAGAYCIDSNGIGKVNASITTAAALSGASAVAATNAINTGTGLCN